MRNIESIRLAIIGLGYVGLPLAVAFARKLPVIGFDISEKRVNQLLRGEDVTQELTEEQIRGAERLAFTNDVAELAQANVYIVTVPTPVDAARQPDFDPLLSASEMVGRVLQEGDIVIYESTVYPGVTEEVCVPVLERESGLSYNTGFFCGYSPERINPGDKQRGVTQIKKVTSGSTEPVAQFVDELYSLIIEAGTYRASSIRVAEASKVVENTQRDLNIAFMNELVQIFDRLGIDTHEVLEAAGTKWNFLPFVPGLVGGHCIGVDPYYLAHKATMLGCHPELILAARRINDQMGPYVANKLLRLMAKSGINVVGAEVLVLGLAFKENCPDIRNTKVTDVIRELRDTNAAVHVCDPWVDPADALAAFDISLVEPSLGAYNAIILAVPHEQFVGPDRTMDLQALLADGGIILDIKGRVPPANNVFRL